MKQESVIQDSGEINGNVEGVLNSYCAGVKTVSETLLLVDTDVRTESEELEKMVQPELLTVVKSPTTLPELDSLTSETLCDDILSCISALDEVIAEFDDSISNSSSSSLVTSGSGTSLQKLQLTSTSATTTNHPQCPCPTPNISNSETYNLQPEPEFTASQFPDSGQGFIMEEADVCRFVDKRSSPRPGQGKVHLDQRPHSTSIPAPIKPARQSKKLNGSGSSRPGPELDNFESSLCPENSRNQNGNQLSFSKGINNSPSQNSFLNNNNISSSRSPSSSPKNPFQPNGCSSRLAGSPGIVDLAGNTTGAVNSFQRIKSKSVDACRTTAKSCSSSPQKPIPITFVMKPEDLERFLENETEEDWNCHIEKNLPRSLRKTRKTCFVEDDEEEQEKYCRSPKDFRKNLLNDSVAKRSPVPVRKPIPEQRPEQIRTALPAQWLRYEDANAICLQEQICTPTSQVNSGQNSHNVNSSNNNNPPHKIYRNELNLNEIFTRKNRQDGSPPIISPPVTFDQVLDIDDGYLSMINRHEAPLLWPEGSIETETFTIEELKRLSASNLNYLDHDKAADYFSDDSLEFEGEVENFLISKNVSKNVSKNLGHGYHPPHHAPHHPPHHQVDKTSSFISASTSSSPVVVQPFINKSSTRKSWSPASEIRIPGKSSINTNTWRKGSIAPSVITLHENSGEYFVLPKKASSPVRKPCAFFIPMNNSEEKAGKIEVSDLGHTSQKSMEKSQNVQLDSLANRVSQTALENGIREAACINALLALPPGESPDESPAGPPGEPRAGLPAEFRAKPPVEEPKAIFPNGTVEFVSVDLSTLPKRTISPLNSSLELSGEERLGSSESERRELETTSSSSGIEYETSSEGQERFLDSLQGISNENQEPEPRSIQPPLQVQPERNTRHQSDDIEDLYENPPPFIPPPPQVIPGQGQGQISKSSIRSSSISETRQRNSAARYSVGSESDRDYFPDNFPSREIAGERPLRTQRQTSRSHENLLDIDRKEMILPHPCVRRGHSATLPSNAVPPHNTRRPSALRQFFGMFRRNKKHSNTNGALDPCVQHKDLGGSLSIVEDDSPQLPEHFSPYRCNRPSISDSHGSQRSNSSKTSTKRSVLSRIFRRREK